MNAIVIACEKIKPATGHARPFAAYFKDGDYTASVLRIEVRKNDRGLFFVAEFVIDSARAINGYAMNAIGSRVSICHNVKFNDLSHDNVRELVAATCGSKYATEDTIESTLIDLGADDQPARGMTIGARSFRKERRGQADFLGVNFYKVCEHDPAATFARRSELDAKGL